MPPIVYFRKTEWIGPHIVDTLFYLLVERYPLCFKRSNYRLSRLESESFLVYLVVDGEAALSDARNGSKWVSL